MHDLVIDGARVIDGLARPTLPGWLTWIEARGLRVSKSRLAVRVSQGHDGAAGELLARDGDAELVVRR